MQVTLNGEAHDLPDDRTTVRDLVEQLGLDGSPVAVEINRAVVPKRLHSDTALKAGDVVEVVTLVGGG